METLIGVVSRVNYESNDNDFKVFTLKRKDRSAFRVTGEFPSVLVGAKIEVHGNFKNHPKYGLGFKAEAYSFDYEDNVRSIAIYIQSIAKWIGPERSAAIAKHFGSDLEKVIEDTPEKLTEVENVGVKVAQNLAEAWDLNRNLKNVRIFLHGLGLTTRKIKRIITMFGPDTEEILKENPWLLCGNGFGFSTCDYIADKLDKDMKSPLRWRAFIQHTIIESSRAGHLYLLPAQLLAACNKFNRKTPFQFQSLEITVKDIAPHVKELITEGYIIKDEQKLYAVRSFFHENESARLLAKVMGTKDTCKLDKVNSDKYVDVYEEQHKIQLSPTQKDAIKSFITEKVMIITGCPGTGKCLGYDTPVMMSDGSTKMVQDIVTGDFLMGDDSTPREVLSTCRGQETLYRVTPKKGDSYVVNESHILSLKESGGTSHVKGRIHDIPIRDYLKLSQNKKDHYKGYRVPVDFSKQEVPLDPYFLGYWLGDGCSSGSGFSTKDPEVIPIIENIAAQYDLKVKKVPGDNVDYRICYDKDDLSSEYDPDVPGGNYIKHALRELNLLDNKHVPHKYKQNDRKTRLELLAGLLDADGHLDKSNSFELTLKSKTLLEGAVFLARSLGFSAHIKPCQKKWSSPRQNNKYRGEGTYYKTHICGEINQIPTKISRKKAEPRKQKKDVLVTGVTLENIGHGDYYGFQISGNGRFLLSDFTVTHNTTIVKALVQMMKENSINYELLTPTGIAAKKLGDTAECHAYTIHRRLGYKGDKWDFNALNKYDTQVVIVDETSMVDMEVFYHLVSALYAGTKLVFVGDVDQLPSVGPGCVLRDLINSQSIKTIFLDQIFRQDECSEIILQAKEIRDGNASMQYFRSDKHADIWHIKSSSVEAIEATILKFSQQLKDNNKMRSEKKYFQIITPRNQGPLSVDTLNIALQGVLNPPADDKKETRINESIIRKGDRIIIRKNKYDLGIYNGDIGKVTHITPEDITVDLEDFGEGTRRVEIPMKFADELIKLAYAITCHKSQGLEYPLVIMPFIKAHGQLLLQRNLLYTAITRAKKKVVILGQASAIESAIRNDKIQKRNTMFSERIQAWITGRGTALRDMFSNPQDFQNAENLELLLLLEEKAASVSDTTRT